MFKLLFMFGFIVLSISRLTLFAAMRRKIFVSFAGVVGLACAALAATNTWDNDSADGLWTTDANWSLDVVPAPGDDIFISNGDTVDFNAGNQSLPAGCTINLIGGSALAEDEVIRLSGSTINVGAGASLAGGFWDMAGGSVTFDDGAAATMATWEQKFDNTFRFNLGPSGFATLEPGTLLVAGHNNTTMSNATYIVDMGSYTGAMESVVLVDFAANNAGVTAETFQWATLVITNAGIYTNAFIAFDDSSHAIEVAFAMPPVTWTGDGSDDSWTTPDNWDTDSVPTASDDVIVGLSASVTNGLNDFDRLTIEAGASVTFSEYTAQGNVISCEGDINYAGVCRLTGAPRITVTGSGRFGPGVTFLDTRG